MIHAIQNDGLYIVNHISSHLKGLPLNTRICKQIACPAINSQDDQAPKLAEASILVKSNVNHADLSDKDLDYSDDDLAETKEERARY
ncbi:hypothetical protein GcM1_098003, partial [Golovinomyces cichoracearum]